MAEQKYDFTHLHVHTEYSLLDGLAKIKDLLARAKELGMDSLAITDHGAMFGVIDFYKEALEQGIKPIIGCEVYITKNHQARENNYYHLILLAENQSGYSNLIKLVSLGFTDGFYYKPRIDLNLLKQYGKGLIGLSACLSGEVSSALLDLSYAQARKIAQAYEDALGKGNFFLELQAHGLEDEEKVNPGLIQLAGELGIPLVCSNDVHYIQKEDAEAHGVLVCIQTNKTIHDEDRMIYHDRQYYLKSPEEMNLAFKYVPEAIQNTRRIADRCQVQFTFHEYKLPKYQLKAGEDAFIFLKTLCLEGLKNRYQPVTEAHLARLEYELAVINSMGFVHYFLVVWDFIKFARDHQIPVGPGRGSGAGSLAAYTLYITDVDPIKYELIFERFLNPERVSMPDFDIDFCYERRQEVIDYVNQKYGADHVAQIITFGTMAARAAIRDVGRALALPYGLVDKIAKQVPYQIGITIKTAMELNPDLQKEYEDDPDIRELLDMAVKLEGLPRHASTHAAGVVICDKPIQEYVPLNRNEGIITTQFPMTTIEELGLLKMDFLGLRTLTVIEDAVKEIRRTQVPLQVSTQESTQVSLQASAQEAANIQTSFSLESLDYADPRVYELISLGHTKGVFQLESAGMTSFMKELKPVCLEDIIAGISLFRPGPMDFIPKYIKGRHNKDLISYTHPSLEPILNKTYGCIVYQEQVMQITRDLAGYSLARSDLVRRAMSKKKSSVMEKERKNFIYGDGGEVPGCIQRGIDQASAEKIFDEMTDFAKYAFNKSHAAAYAMIGYQTAWLKTYYPVPFMAALLSSVMGWGGKIADYIEECKRMNIPLLPPSINDSFGHFTVEQSEGKASIRFGLLAVKNVSRNTVAALVNERKNGKFTSLAEFVNRIMTNERTQDINKRCIESLICVGAFDGLGGKRSQYLAVYENLISGTAQSKRNTLSGQMSLLDIGFEMDVHKDELPHIEEREFSELLALEKALTGIYLSGHPLEPYKKALQAQVTASSLDFAFNPEEEPKLRDGSEVCIGGLVVEKSVKYTKSNKAMTFLKVEDFLGSIEVIVFPTVYQLCTWLAKDMVICVRGKVDMKEEEDGKLIADRVFKVELTQAEQQPASATNSAQASNKPPGRPSEPSPQQSQNAIQRSDHTQSERPSSSSMQNQVQSQGPSSTPSRDSAKARTGLWLNLEGKALEPHRLTEILTRHRGSTPVYLVDRSKNLLTKMKDYFWVEPNQELIKSLKELLGEEAVVIRK